MKLNPRAMLSRYLRATGWVVVPRGAYPNDPMWYRGATAECIVGSNGGVPSIDDAAPFYDVTPAEMAMRLGLCAAAEDCLETMRSLGLPEIVGAQAERIFRLAGVARNTWEAARED